jgi:NTE family protein
MGTPNGKEKNSSGLETVLVMQGGGSLGAYECGVYKTLVKHDIKFDIVSGTSIGAVNAAIIATHSSHHNSDRNSAGELEKFWLELAEALLPLTQEYSSLYITDELRALFASTYSAIFGNPKAFFPLWPASMWREDDGASFRSYLHPFPYPLFDITPLKNTLGRYVDFTKLKNNNSSRSLRYPRLIVTATDVQTSRPVIFDSNSIDFDLDSIIASAGFPFYGISWTKKDGRYLWDGALLNSTPLREVIDASPMTNKIVYLISIFPHYQWRLPQDMYQVWHRARDIIYTDKTDTNIRLSKIISRYLSLLNEFHDLLTTITKSNHIEYDLDLKKRFAKIEKEYEKLALQRGTIIKKIIRIERPEKTHFLFEDADFSITTIKKLIKQGERDAEKVLRSQVTASD